MRQMMFIGVTGILLSALLQAQSGGSPASPLPSRPSAAFLIGIPARQITPASTGWVATTIVHARYPLDAPDPNREGEVLVRANISETGEVESAKTIKGDDSLRACAADAISHWKFEPKLKKGSPKKATIVVPLKFVLAQRIDPDRTKVQATLDTDHKLVQLDGDTSENLLVRWVEPTYPAQALNMRLQGQVLLSLTIGKDGVVRDLKVVSAHPVLVHAAVDAVQQWRYEPYQIGGSPVEAQTLVTLDFIGD